MTCANIENFLPLAATEALSHTERQQVHDHCQACSACAQEWHALQRTLHLLTEGSPCATARVDVAAILSTETQRCQKRIKRWRSVAIGVTAAASILLATLAFTRLEFRWEEKQFTICWGTPQASPAPAQPSPTKESPALANLTDQWEARFSRVEKLVLLISDDMQAVQTQESQLDRRGRQTAEFVNLLARQLDDLRQETRRDRSALYAAMQPTQQPGKE